MALNDGGTGDSDGIRNKERGDDVGREPAAPSRHSLEIGLLLAAPGEPDPPPSLGLAVAGVGLAEPDGVSPGEGLAESGGGEEGVSLGEDDSGGGLVGGVSGEEDGGGLVGGWSVGTGGGGSD